MATVELTFTPLPAHVRTARLVATAVARRSGVEESLLDEVRLAVGEACSRAVEAHRLHCPAEPVRIELSDRGGRFVVVVTDAVPGSVDDAAGDPAGDSAVRTSVASKDSASAEDAASAAARGAASAVGPAGTAGGPAGSAGPAGSGPAPTAVTKDGGVNGRLPAGIGLAVITGLADDVEISATGDGVSIRMSWPRGAMI